MVKKAKNAARGATAAPDPGRGQVAGTAGKEEPPADPALEPTPPTVPTHVTDAIRRELFLERLRLGGGSPLLSRAYFQELPEPDLAALQTLPALTPGVDFYPDYRDDDFEEEPDLSVDRPPPPRRPLSPEEFRARLKEPGFFPFPGIRAGEARAPAGPPRNWPPAEAPRHMRPTDFFPKPFDQMSKGEKATAYKRYIEYENDLNARSGALETPARSKPRSRPRLGDYLDILALPDHEQDRARRLDTAPSPRLKMKRVQTEIPTSMYLEQDVGILRDVYRRRRRSPIFGRRPETPGLWSDLDPARTGDFRGGGDGDVLAYLTHVGINQSDWESMPADRRLRIVRVLRQLMLIECALSYAFDDDEMIPAEKALGFLEALAIKVEKQGGLKNGFPMAVKLRERKLRIRSTLYFVEHVIDVIKTKFERRIRDGEREPIEELRAETNRYLAVRLGPRWKDALTRSDLDSFLVADSPRAIAVRLIRAKDPSIGQDELQRLTPQRSRGAKTGPKKRRK